MIYLLKSNDKLKIGYAKDIEARLKQYKLHNPDIEFISSKEGEFSDEKRLHKLCSKYQVQNEWYKYCDEVVDIFNSFVTKDYNEIDVLKKQLKDKSSRIIELESLNNELLNRLTEKDRIIDKYREQSFISSEIAKEAIKIANLSIDKLENKNETINTNLTLE